MQVACRTPVGTVSPGSRKLWENKHPPQWWRLPAPLSSTHPLADGGAPAHDAALQPGVRSDPRSFQHGAALYPHAVLHHHASADGDVGADGAVLSDLCRRVLRRDGGGLGGAGDRLDRPTARTRLTTRTLPRKPGPVCRRSGARCRSDWRYMHIPVRKSFGWPMSIQKPAEGRRDVQRVVLSHCSLEPSTPPNILLE